MTPLTWLLSHSCHTTSKLIFLDALLEYMPALETLTILYTKMRITGPRVSQKDCLAIPPTSHFRLVNVHGNCTFYVI